MMNERPGIEDANSGRTDLWQAIGDEDLFDRQLGKALPGFVRENSMGSSQANRSCPMLKNKFYPLNQCSPRVDDVVDEDDIFPTDIPMKNFGNGNIWPRPHLVDHTYNRMGVEKPCKLLSS